MVQEFQIVDQKQKPEGNHHLENSSSERCLYSKRKKAFDKLCFFFLISPRLLLQRSCLVNSEQGLAVQRGRQFVFPRCLSVRRKAFDSAVIPLQEATKAVLEEQAKFGPTGGKKRIIRDQSNSGTTIKQRHIQ